MKIFNMLITLLCLVCTTLQAQKPDDRINLREINTPYLEELIKAKVDSFRMAHGIHPLQADSLLYLAAADHADYLVLGNTGGHTQVYPAKATPQKRVEYYGGKDFYVGENVAITAVQRKLVSNPKHGDDAIDYISTYRDAARALFLQWYYSPGHRKNMLKKEYRETAVALAVDASQSKVVAVQLFAWQGHLPVVH